MVEAGNSQSLALRKLYSAQKFRGAHPPLSFQLNIRQGQSAIRGGNDKFSILAQNFARLAAKIDNRRRENLQLLIVEVSKRAGPWIVSANFAFENFRSFIPIEATRFAVQLWRIGRDDLILWNMRRVSVTE